MTPASKSEIDTAKWRDALDRLLSSFPQRDTGIAAEAPQWASGRSIVIVGPTGSGKSALVNALLGFSLLPEGTDHTTPVPTVVRKADEFVLKALDYRNETVPGVPDLALDASLLPTDYPTDQEATLARICRREDIALLRDRWNAFWAPAFQAAKADRCAWIEARVPASFLPPNVALVDVPGYEGWFPEQCPRLHSLVQQCLAHAGRVIFVMEKTKVLLSGSFEFLKRPLERGTPSTLVINQMDEFNPFQFGATSLEDYSVWEGFRRHLRERLKEQGVPADSLAGIFLSAAVQRRPTVEPAWLGHALLTEMLGLFLHLRDTGASESYRVNTGPAQEYDPEPVEELLNRELERLRSAVTEAGAAARLVFIDRHNALWVKARVSGALDEVEFDFWDAFTVDHRAELAARMEKAALDAAAAALQELFRPALERYHDLVALHVKTALQVNLRAQYATGVLSALDTSRLNFGRELSPARLYSDLERHLQIFLPGVGIVANLIDVLVGWSTDDVRASVKERILPMIDPPLLLRIWHDADTERLTERTLKILWEGRDAGGGPVGDFRGEVWPGLETLIRAAVLERTNQHSSKRGEP